jgi:hypothetical protein
VLRNRNQFQRTRIVSDSHSIYTAAFHIGPMQCSMGGCRVFTNFALSKSFFEPHALSESRYTECKIVSISTASRLQKYRTNPIKLCLALPSR